MKPLIDAVRETPIIDHHAHNLLLPSHIASRQFLSITTEANGQALEHTASTLAHIRAVKQLAHVLDSCEPTWEAVQDRIREERNVAGDNWARRCLFGIESVLIDDGLDEDTVYPYSWHDRLVRSKCKRIVRIEKVAEEVLKKHLKQHKDPNAVRFIKSPSEVIGDFLGKIGAAIKDPEVAGFKSVICYRTGLAIPDFGGLDFPAAIEPLFNGNNENSIDPDRLEDECLGPYFVHLTARLLAQSASGSQLSKPLQFHTGLGDNDISLQLSSPSHLESFIETYPAVPVVLLHASYPFTKEAGYLTSVYKNVFMDIGEVFPMVSQDGQERVVREALELCPTEKLMWSTDGHWFPETFLLAVMQVRDAMEKVLTEYVLRGALDVNQAVKAVEDIFFNTSNKLYKLGLSLPSPSQAMLQRNYPWAPSSDSKKIDPAPFIRFLSENPSTKYLRLQWLDYTATNRVRILPINHALLLFREGKSLGITKAVLGLTQNDLISPGFGATGEYSLTPCFESLRRGQRFGYATVQCEFREKTREEVAICPRTALRRIVEKAATHGLQFLIGFEIEVVFMGVSFKDGLFHYGENALSEGHAWSTSRALQSNDVTTLIEAILDAFENSSIGLQQFHPESSPGQYEFVLDPLPPLQAIDTLLAAREIISTLAATLFPQQPLRATFIPRPSPNAAGTGAHVHISMAPSANCDMFYAGVLKHLQAIVAFTYSNSLSYERVKDGIWAGGSRVAWGTQNRETPLRKIEDSHWEVKCVDGLANMYLALSAILGAGLQGILDREELIMKDCLADPSTLSARELLSLGIQDNIPANFPKALACLRRDEALKGAVGREMVDAYLAVKGKEGEILEGMGEDKRRQWLIESFPINDFIAGLILIKDILKALDDGTGSSTEYRGLIQEPSSRENALVKMTNLNLGEIQQSQHTAVEQIAAQCQNTINEFITRVKKYQPILRSGGPSPASRDSTRKTQRALCEGAIYINDKERVPIASGSRRSTVSQYRKLDEQSEEIFGQGRALRTIQGSIQESHNVLTESKNILAAHGNLFRVLNKQGDVEFGAMAFGWNIEWREKTAEFLHWKQGRWTATKRIDWNTEEG
ncbi:hypothetical protein FGG08_001150 [Glutinoglossum americanum]|uniref:GS catalytic domain-containing protein n=1 Tax=Glutinoglossum americanum TaxID=1670608 RepID=A0A9P8L0L0_9PEZI|nr:hypothetical protein FGG08_001150 [Glutinoglossum americanum]